MTVAPHTFVQPCLIFAAYADLRCDAERGTVKELSCTTYRLNILLRSQRTIRQMRTVAYR